ncbi:hypothetical protein RRSWK_01269 [Rhodopirellula sp. SWK7]|nr:hypothetical protein RRSWK_01269 [Rhodopirellula sp. SWK7]
MLGPERAGLRESSGGRDDAGREACDVGEADLGRIWALTARDLILPPVETCYDSVKTIFLEGDAC